MYRSCFLVSNSFLHLWKSRVSCLPKVYCFAAFSYLLFVCSVTFWLIHWIFQCHSFSKSLWISHSQLFLLSFLISLFFVSSSQAAMMLKIQEKLYPQLLTQVISTGQIHVRLNSEPFQLSSKEPLADRSNNVISLKKRFFLLPLVLGMQSVIFQGYRGTRE